MISYGKVSGAVGMYANGRRRESEALPVSGSA